MARTDIVELTRETVERTAYVIGAASAAAAALKDADAHPGPVRFYQAGSSIIVEKLPASGE